MIYSSWDIEQNILKLVTLGHFLPFYPLKTQKSKFWKMKKFAEDIIILHMCTKNHNIWLWFQDTEWQRHKLLLFWAIFCPFTIPKIKNLKKKKKKRKKCLEILSFYTFICTINEDHMIYGSWNIRCDRQKFSIFWAIFCPVSLLTTWKIKILTLKKTTGDTTILHICTINDNHMIHGSWDIKCDRHNFLSFWTWRYYLFTNINDNHMMYSSSGMECNGQKFCHFGLCFAFLPP